MNMNPFNKIFDLDKLPSLKLLVLIFKCFKMHSSSSKFMSLIPPNYVTLNKPSKVIDIIFKKKNSKKSNKRYMCQLKPTHKPQIIMSNFHI